MSTLTDGLKAGLRVGVDLAGKAVIAGAVTALPILGAPIINQCFVYVVNWVIGKLYPFLEVWFVDRAIDIEMNAKKEAYEHAREELRAILATHVRDPKQLQAASQDFDSRFDKLVRIRP